MAGYLLLGIAALVGGLLFLNWFVNASPKAAKRGVIIVSCVIAGLVIAAFAVSGRLGLLFGFLLLTMPFLARAYRRARASGGGVGSGGGGRRSEIVTAYLRMSLDQQSGEMSGEVLQGRFAGMQLADLDQADLLALYEECRQHDRDGMAVLEAWLDRVIGPDWRQATGGGHERGQGAAGGRPGGAAMSRAEAYEVLGLSEGASEADIKAAHRRLMARMHPDHGGSDYMAAKLNQAKEILLGG